MKDKLHQGMSKFQRCSKFDFFFGRCDVSDVSRNIQKPMRCCTPIGQR